MVSMIKVTGANKNIATPVALVDKSGLCVTPTINVENTYIVR